MLYTYIHRIDLSTMEIIMFLGLELICANFAAEEINCVRKFPETVS